MMSVSTQNTLNRTIHLSNIIRAQYASGPIALPVNGYYTRLKHVQGIPTTDSGTGYSVSKLRMIDQMVERLVRLKGGTVDVSAPVNGGDSDALLAAYAAELGSVIRSASIGDRSYAAGVAEPGFLFSMVA